MRHAAPIGAWLKDVGMGGLVTDVFVRLADPTKFHSEAAAELLRVRNVPTILQHLKSET